MTQVITVQGLVATTPRHLITQDGVPIATFRLASSERKFDRARNQWIDGETNWFTVTSYRTLGINVAASINKGDRVLITGTLSVRDWDNGEREGTSVEIEATSMGHDLAWGTSTFTRTFTVSETEGEN
jgi:single-strand DNA-binding protein